KFYTTVVDASFACGEPQVCEGPDGFPYFGLHSPPPMQPFDAYSISHLLELVTENGVGIALNPRGNDVDWVFTYGELVSLRAFGAFDADTPFGDPPPAEENDEKGETTVILGEPSESVLPGYCRRALAAYLKESVGIKKPGVFLMWEELDGKLGRSWCS